MFASAVMLWNILKLDKGTDPARVPHALQEISIGKDPVLTKRPIKFRTFLNTYKHVYFPSSSSFESSDVRADSRASLWK